ncbi:hypothetical protein CKO28_09765 [Rhodovibrio sodomensis]|uniref:Uncharacterized protein n=1 Tax=Rhodovibrio sodomensis TaxID=1088 RepID=A0ABS1DD73_9PROT|nr:hypothetical protein [Rhodovibrio sodomensis]MBK1668320.1 hypothetical protein [Rhodovibrio sodomensis]
MAERMPNWPLSSSFDRQVAELRRVASEIRTYDPEGAAACLFAASVLMSIPGDQGVGWPGEGPGWPQDGNSGN